MIRPPPGSTLFPNPTLFRSLVEPVDEMVGNDSKASHPELLDLLAAEFAAHNFDVKYLIRAITATRTYQLTSAGAARSEEHTSELQSRQYLVCRLLLEKKK